MQNDPFLYTDPILVIFSHSSLEARLREERLAAALYDTERESQQRERELRAYYIRSTATSRHAAVVSEPEIDV